MVNKLTIHIANSRGVTKEMRDFAITHLTPIHEILESYETPLSYMVRVKVRKDKSQKLELTITTNKTTYRREFSGDNYYDLLLLAAEAIKKGIYSRQEKLTQRKRRKGYDKKGRLNEESLNHTFNENPQEEISLKIKEISTKPMDVEDAGLMLEDLGHDFYLFLDSATGLPSVLYRRKEEGFGLIRLNTM